MSSFVTPVIRFLHCVVSFVVTLLYVVNFDACVHKMKLEMANSCTWSGTHFWKPFHWIGDKMQHISERMHQKNFPRLLTGSYTFGYSSRVHLRTYFLYISIRTQIILRQHKIREVELRKGRICNVNQLNGKSLCASKISIQNSGLFSMFFFNTENTFIMKSSTNCNSSYEFEYHHFFVFLTAF